MYAMGSENLIHRQTFHHGLGKSLLFLELLSADLDLLRCSGSEGNPLLWFDLDPFNPGPARPCDCFQSKLFGYNNLGGEVAYPNP